MTVQSVVSQLFYVGSRRFQGAVLIESLTEEIYHALEQYQEHLRFARNTCANLEKTNANLEKANANLEKDSRLTRKLVREVYRKLLGTADPSDRMERGVADSGDKLPHGPDLVSLHHEMNEMRRLVADLEKEKALLQETMDRKDHRYRQRRLNEKTSLMQKRICAANARIEELLGENGKLARELERFKREPELEEALRTAKEEVARYEAKTIRDQDSLRESNRRLASCQSDLREAQIALGVEVVRLQEDYDARVEALKQSHEQKMAASRERVYSTIDETAKSWQEHERNAVAQAVADVTAQRDREAQQTDKQMEELLDQINSEFTKKKRELRRAMKDLSQENGALRERLENQGKPSDQVADDLPRYLPSNDPPEQSELVQELRTKIADLEAKLRMEQQEFQERVQAAVVEQRQIRPWEENFQEVSEERERLRETLLYANRERNSLLKERENLMKVWDYLPQAQADLEQAQRKVAELDGLAAAQAEEAEQQKKVVSELKEEVEGLRQSYQAAVASQEAVLKANTKLQSDLQDDEESSGHTRRTKYRAGGGNLGSQGSARGSRQEACKAP